MDNKESDLPFHVLLHEAAEMFSERMRHPEEGSLMCSIHATYDPPERAGHNCIGCNFNDMTSHLEDFLKISVSMGEPEHVFFTYVLLVNSIWERMRDIFDIVGVPEEYRKKKFKPFYRSRRWANFYKHPKSFTWLIHHPTYIIDGSTYHQSLSTDSCLFIDDNFVRDHYQSVKNPPPDEAYEAHRETAYVVMPNILILTKNLCYSLEHFVELITKNPVYVEMLSDKATILDFYKEVSDTGPEIISNVIPSEILLS